MLKKRKHRIIVLEDDRTSRKLITRCLDEAGYESIECHECKDALHGAEMWPPTVMIVDVMLPDMQGTEFVARLREDPSLQDIRIVFLTGILKGKPDENDFRFKIGNEFFPALSKPVNYPRLLSLVAEEVETSIEIKKQRKEQERLEKEAAAEKLAATEEPAEPTDASEDWPEQAEDSSPAETNGLEYERGNSR